MVAVTCRKYPQSDGCACRDFGPYLVLGPVLLSESRRTGTRTACAYEGITVTTARHDDETDDTQDILDEEHFKPTGTVFILVLYVAMIILLWTSVYVILLSRGVTV